MKTIYRRALGAVLTAAAGLLLFSCESLPEPDYNGGKYFPLVSGWYLYEFDRTGKGFESEYHYSVSTGMTMVQEMTLGQTGTVVYIEDGFLQEPDMSVRMIVDRWGQIRGADNPSVSGSLSADGSFFWTGLVEQEGKLSFVRVEGNLTWLPPEYRADSAYSGIYHLTETGGDRELLVRIDEGLYTWRRIAGPERGEASSFPGLVGVNGSFVHDSEYTTILEIGESNREDYTSAHYAITSRIRGRADNGMGISFEESFRVSQLGGHPGNWVYRSYSGSRVGGEEYPQELIPPELHSLAQIPVQEGKLSAPADFSHYPDWYHEPPVRENRLYTAGGHSSENRETGFALAERAAAASLALKLRSLQGQTPVSPAPRLLSPEELPYRVAARRYDDAAKTAFVLLELSLNDIKK